LAVAVASYTPLHVNGTWNENDTSDDRDGSSVVGVVGVDGSGSIVVVVVVEYVTVWSAGAGRQSDAAASLEENSMWSSTEEIGAGGVWRNTPLNSASDDVEKLDGEVKLEPCHGSAGLWAVAACDRPDPKVVIAASAARVNPALASTLTGRARERRIGRFMLLAATARPGPGR
jgi:hypothetical protein